MTFVKQYASLFFVAMNKFNTQTNVFPLSMRQATSAFLDLEKGAQHFENFQHGKITDESMQVGAKDLIIIVLMLYERHQ